MNGFTKETNNHRHLNGLSSFIFMVGFAATLAGCRVALPVQMPEIRNLPDSFQVAATDTANIANLSWREFFTDPRLVALIDTALQHNTDLQIALQRVHIARAQLRMHRAAFFPSLGAGAGAAFERFGDYTMDGVGNFDTNLSPNIKEDQRIPTAVTPDLFLGFRSNWEIDVRGKLKNRKRAAQARMLATEQGRQYVITELVAEVATLYYEMLALDNELMIVSKNVQLQQEALEVVKVQKEGGRATELAVQQFAAQLLNTGAIEYSIRQRLVEVENQLNLLAGRYPQRIERDTSMDERHMPAVLHTGVPYQLLIRRPDIRQAELELDAAKADIQAARAEFFPSLNLSLYTGFNAFKSGLLFNPGSIVYGAAAGLAAPIFNGREIREGYTIAGARGIEAAYHYQQSLLSCYVEVVTNLQSIENRGKMLELKKEEVHHLVTAVSNARDLYLAGYATYLEIITAQKGVLDAEIQLTENKKHLLQSVVSLYRSLGGGWF